MLSLPYVLFITMTKNLKEETYPTYPRFEIEIFHAEKTLKSMRWPETKVRDKRKKKRKRKEKKKRKIARLRVSVL